MKNHYSEMQPDGLSLSFDVKRPVISTHSKYQKIDIVETSGYGLLLALDEMVMLTERDEFFYHEMISHVPLNSHPNPENVLIIGGGDGGTARECTVHDQVKNVDVCELDEEVIRLSREHLPFVGKGFDDKRVNIYIEDGFKFLQNKHRRGYYDVILVDSPDPIGPAAKLFQREFYKRVKNCLKIDGILCLQSESPLAFADTVAKVHKSLSKLFGSVQHYTCPIPTYPSGYWSFAMASDNKPKLYPKKAEKIQENTKYYNSEIHRACFALPNFFKQIIE